MSKRFKSTSKKDLVGSIKRSIRGKEACLKSIPKHTRQDMKKEIKTLKWALGILERVMEYENSENLHDRLMLRIGKRFPNE